MVLIVFGGEGKAKLQLPRVMEWPLLPLAVLGIGGGLLNLPEYIGPGFLASFLQNADPTMAHATELLLQGVAAGVALAGMAVAWFRYGGAQRSRRMAEAGQPARGLNAFLLEGWRIDALYDSIIVRPYTWLASFLWQRLDEGCIDDSLDRGADWLGRCGQWLGSRGGGRVSSSLLGMACGAALIIFWLAWVVS
jgi:NADH-quinone oxidoreductase subunit L